MVILHIQHRIADLDTWLQDFASRAPARKQAGVTTVRMNVRYTSSKPRTIRSTS
jgi:hypothetical protein